MFNCVSIDYFFCFLVISLATPSANTLTKEGIVFNFHQRVLIADKFIKVQLIVPYPVIEIQLTENLTALADKFIESWKTRVGRCHDLAFPDLEELDATDHLNFTWLVTKIIEKHGNAITDLNSTKKALDWNSTGKDSRPAQLCTKSVEIIEAETHCSPRFSGWSHYSSWRWSRTRQHDRMCYQSNFLSLYRVFQE